MKNARANFEKAHYNHVILQRTPRPTMMSAEGTDYSAPRILSLSRAPKSINLSTCKPDGTSGIEHITKAKYNRDVYQQTKQMSNGQQWILTKDDTPEETEQQWIITKDDTPKETND